MKAVPVIPLHKLSKETIFGLKGPIRRSVLLDYNAIVPESPFDEEGALWPIYVKRRWVWVRPPLVCFSVSAILQEGRESAG